MVAVHLKRYVFALPWCRGRRVVEVGSGAGYGAALVAAVAERLVAVDCDAGVIAAAHRDYQHRNLHFAAMDGVRLGVASGSADVVLGFEVIEHVADPEDMIAELARVLRPGGVAILSTPHASRTTRRPQNPFHRVEYSRQDFAAILGRRFASVQLLAQVRRQSIAHCWLRRLDPLHLRGRLPRRWRNRIGRWVRTTPFDEMSLADLSIRDGHWGRAQDIVAVCEAPRGGSSH